MKKLILFVLVAFFANGTNAQDFITRWNLSYTGTTPNSISFNVGTTGTVNYTWETVPAGTTGSGTFNGTSATITGLPTGSIIQLKINPTNFNRIKIGFGVDKQRLVDVEQWGNIIWSSMDSAFMGCNHLNISSTDIPDLSSTNSMANMFLGCTILNGPSNIDFWNTSNVTNMNFLFGVANAFNQPIGNWNTSNVINMSHIFDNAYAFNQPIGNWNTSNVINMSGMFYRASNFNQPIGNWNTSNVTTMESMFNTAMSFNQIIGNWNTSNVTDMSYMFCFAVNFNQPIGNWNTSNVTTMKDMFAFAELFNQSIGNWNTSNVSTMEGMFATDPGFISTFNQPIGNWDVSNVINMSYMFFRAFSFNQTIGSWNISSVTAINGMFRECGMDCSNYSSTLYGWANNVNTPNGINLGLLTLHYGTNVQAERDYLINNKGWTITGDTMNNNSCCFPELITLYQIACNSYLFNNQNLTLSGIYIDTFINVYNCDSIVMLNLSISNNPSFNTINQTTCNSYTFNNQILTTSGTYFDTLINSTGCDSIITLNLTINNSTSSTQNQTSCNSYAFNNQTLTQSGTYYDTLINSTGCDSIITLNLTINNPNIVTSQNGTQLYATASGASYQWLKCNPYSIISGATNQTYTATANGDYAVIVTQNGCSDTSNCMTVNSVGIDELNTQNLITISPNPTHSIFKIECPMNGAKLILYNSFGQKLLTSKIENLSAQAGQTSLIDISHFSKGIYIAEIIDDKTSYRVKIIKD